MNPATRHIGINIGGGYVPGLNYVVRGVVLAASELGWDVIGIKDGFDGLLFPERYPSGGLLHLTNDLVESLSSGAGAILGTNPRTDPFRVQAVNAENEIEELDKSDQLLEEVKAQGIDAVISIVSSQALNTLFRLHRKGLKVVCIPKSVENDVAATQLSFGFNSALSFTVDMLENARLAAHSTRKIVVVEVPGQHTGWLALQSAMTACADAVLVPEIPYDLRAVAAKLKKRAESGHPYGLVVVAEGANSAAVPDAGPDNPLKKSLAPMATNQQGRFIIDRTGLAAHSVSLELQRLTGQETYALVLGQLVKGGSTTALDRHLGLGYGAAAVRALKEDRPGVMVAFQPPETKFVPLAEAINKVRTLPLNGLFTEIARSLGVSLGN
ncbi:MAG TPA: 6-phosphofructokinase [Terriglobales bacterium]|nr:6-phosphofructokinase [Terriglobales bacterium]